jgi:cytochrome c-type biogenesis protein CcmH
VLLRPPMEPATYVLWFAPIGLLLAGLAGTAFWLRRRTTSTPADRPLDAGEERKLEQLLRDDA